METFDMISRKGQGIMRFVEAQFDKTTPPWIFPGAVLFFKSFDFLDSEGPCLVLGKPVVHKPAFYYFATVVIFTSEGRIITVDAKELFPL